MLCFASNCIKALKTDAIYSGNVESAFIKTGFRNLKKACEKGRGLLKHKGAETHKGAVQRFIQAYINNNSVGDLLSANYEIQKEQNRNNLLKVYQTSGSWLAKGSSFVEIGTIKTAVNLIRTFINLIRTFINWINWINSEHKKTNNSKIG